MTIQNSIASLQNWHQAKKMPIDYNKAIAKFESDLASIQRLDRDAGTATTDSVGINFSSGAPYYADSDPRPGEVEVRDAGSLHSTPEGFSLRVLESSSLSALGYGSVLQEACSREYQINNQNGTICVIDNVGPSAAGGFHGISSSPGHTEKYTIDTIHGTIADYSKVPNQPPSSPLKLPRVFAPLQPGLGWA